MECKHLMNPNTCIDCNTGCCEDPRKLFEEDGCQWDFCGNCLNEYEDNKDNEGSK